MTPDDPKPRVRAAARPQNRGRHWIWAVLVIGALLGAFALLRTIQQKRELVTLHVVLHQGDQLAYRVTMSAGTDRSVADGPDSRSVAVTLSVTGVSSAGVATIEATVRTTGGAVNE